MTLNILFASSPEDWAAYETPLQAAFDKVGLTTDLRADFPPDQVDYIVYAPDSTVQDFTVFTRLKAVFSLWAGVEKIVGNQTLNVPLTRMVDFGLRQGMVEWVTGHVLRYHLGMDAHINANPGEWDPVAPPLSRDRRVTILGLGELGTACGQALDALGFPVSGWSRTAKSVPGITCFHGDEGLTQALELADILVLLLPNTPQTQNTLNADTLAVLPRGAFVLNPGRGPLIDDDALLAALDAGQVAHATLDVFRTEPLPLDHPYWHHPNVTVTPHIAAATRTDSASKLVAENLRLSETGAPLLHLVDRSRGY